jgi:2-C-methyl-D-erythritol 2,4-cyclodiphosphate synthase
MYRVGLGQDSHELKKGKQGLRLAGVKVNGGYYLVADSDGDVVTHSLCNALSTAIGGGSLDTWAGAMFKKGITDSREFLKEILKRMKGEGFKVVNVAIMVEGSRPRLEGEREKMQRSLAKLLGIKKKDVGIAFTSGEGLTSFGKGEGLQAMSMVLIYK